MATLVLFTIVFVIGGASHVRQLNVDAAIGLWRLWGIFWPLLLLGNLLALPLVTGAVVFPPYGIRAWSFTLLRLLAVLTTAFALHAAMRFFPDA